MGLVRPDAMDRHYAERLVARFERDGALPPGYDRAVLVAALAAVGAFQDPTLQALAVVAAWTLAYGGPPAPPGIDIQEILARTDPLAALEAAEIGRANPVRAPRRPGGDA